MTDIDDIFRALSVAVRRDMLIAMIEEDRTVRNLTERTDITQSAVSQHLAVLKEAGLVRDRKVGRNRYYAAQTSQLLLLDDWLEPFRERWAGTLDALETHLDHQKN